MSKKLSKNTAKARGQVENRPYALADAVPLLKKIGFAKFDETVDLTLRLGVDPKHAAPWCFRMAWARPSA
jgi:large subunit ribosomal protein L1